MTISKEVAEIREKSLRQKYPRCIWVYIKLDNEQSFKMGKSRYRIKHKFYAEGETKHKYIFVLLKGSRYEAVAFVSEDMEDLTDCIVKE